MLRVHIATVAVAAVCILSTDCTTSPHRGGGLIGLKQILNPNMCVNNQDGSPVTSDDCMNGEILLLREILKLRARGVGGHFTNDEYYGEISRVLNHDACETDVLNELLCMDTNRNGQVDRNGKYIF
ncbi:hypothetical protein SNE40_017771 [Patella caerulea]|uniref:Uncharacterized protein n=1 Tax=Patella caerulea TaxID=87958 RepID=A0AAN8PGF1_PATCE